MIAACLCLLAGAYLRGEREIPGIGQDERRRLTVPPAARPAQRCALSNLHVTGGTGSRSLARGQAPPRDPRHTLFHEKTLSSACCQYFSGTIRLAVRHAVFDSGSHLGTCSCTMGIEVRVTSPPPTPPL